MANENTRVTSQQHVTPEELRISEVEHSYKPDDMSAAILGTSVQIRPSPSSFGYSRPLTVISIDLVEDTGAFAEAVLNGDSLLNLL